MRRGVLVDVVSGGGEMRGWGGGNIGEVLGVEVVLAVV